MPVNFLPLPDDTPQDEVDVSSLSSSVDLSERREAITDNSAGSVEYRTKICVSTLPSETSSRVDMDDVDQPEDAEVDRQPDIAPLNFILHLCFYQIIKAAWQHLVGGDPNSKILPAWKFGVSSPSSLNSLQLLVVTATRFS
ncbi:hypothetical protein GJAV_G00005280 [Gymnothorax javanicus]|nr:hypothetical protein GJAV_G00005280 [Gymnothorax javanicus]